MTSCARSEIVDSASDQKAWRILIVEDEYVVAFDMCRELEAMGHKVVGPAGTLEQALRLASTANDLQGAILDMNLSGKEIFPVADILLQRKVPFVFATGYGTAALPERFSSIVQIEKPVAITVLRQALLDMCKGEAAPCGQLEGSFHQ